MEHVSHMHILEHWAMSTCRLICPIRHTDIYILTDTMCKSLHDIVLLFLFLLQREYEQLRVSLLIVHLIKVVRQVSESLLF